MSGAAPKYIGQGRTDRDPSGHPSSPPNVRVQPEAHPTVLVAGKSEMRGPLVASLLRDNCLVLEAESFSRIVEIVKFHSRPIHVLLLDVGLSAADAEDALKPFRPAMQIVFVNQASPDNALAGVRELLRLPWSH